MKIEVCNRGNAEQMTKLYGIMSARLYPVHWKGQLPRFVNLPKVKYVHNSISNPNDLIDWLKENRPIQIVLRRVTFEFCGLLRIIGDYRIYSPKNTDTIEVERIDWHDSKIDNIRAFISECWIERERITEPEMIAIDSNGHILDNEYCDCEDLMVK